MTKSVRGVTFSLSNLKEATAFYERSLWLDKKYAYSSYAGFQFGGVEVGLRPGRKEKRHTVDTHSIQFSVDNVDALYEEFRRNGINFVEEPHDGPSGGREAGFPDSNGTLLEMVQNDWRKYFEVGVKRTKAR